MSIVAAGDPVPDVSFRAEDGSRISTGDLAADGRTTVLVFYPYAFSPLCTDQLQLYQEVLEEIEAQNAQVFGVSCDAHWSQKAFREQLGVTIRQLSDFEPKGAACRAFGVYHPDGFPQRALVVFDGGGTVRFSHQARTPAELPGANLIFDGLAAAV